MNTLYSGGMASSSSVRDLPGDPWEVRITKQVIRSIVYYKESLGMTTAELAARYSEVSGDEAPMNPTTLNNILAGKRKSISIAEIITFALVLNVPPVFLIVPLVTEGTVEGYPGSKMSPVTFFENFVGRSYRGFDDLEGPDEPAVTRHVNQMLDRYLDAERDLRNDVSALGHVALFPGNYNLPQSILDRRLQEVIDQVAIFKDARNDLAKWPVVMPDLDRTLRWTLHVKPGELTMEVIRDLYLDAFVDTNEDGGKDDGATSNPS